MAVLDSLGGPGILKRTLDCGSGVVHGDVARGCRGWRWVTLSRSTHRDS